MVVSRHIDRLPSVQSTKIQQEQESAIDLSPVRIYRSGFIAFDDEGYLSWMPY